MSQIVSTNLPTLYYSPISIPQHSSSTNRQEDVASERSSCKTVLQFVETNIPNKSPYETSLSIEIVQVKHKSTKSFATLGSVRKTNLLPAKLEKLVIREKCRTRKHAQILPFMVSQYSVFLFLFFNPLYYFKYCKTAYSFHFLEYFRNLYNESC